MSFSDFDVSVGATSSAKVVVNEVVPQNGRQWSDDACILEVTSAEVITVEGADVDVWRASGTCPPGGAVQSMGDGDTVVGIEPFTLRAITRR